MSEIATLTQATRALHKLDRAFQFGQNTEQPGLITATHTATWHVAGLLEQLRSLRAEQLGMVRRGELSAGPVRPDEEPTP